MKAHKQVTGVDADFWGSPVYYAVTQLLSESIEAVGLDRRAVTKYIKSRTFDTIIGKVDLRKQNHPVFWTVGQWQNGVFEGVKGVGTTGEKSVKLKTGW